MMIQFSHLGKLVEHHSSLYNCSDFSSWFSTNSIKYASTWRVPQRFDLLIGLYISAGISNSFCFIFKNHRASFTSVTWTLCIEFPSLLQKQSKPLLIWFRFPAPVSEGQFCLLNIDWKESKSKHSLLTTSIWETCWVERSITLLRPVQQPPYQISPSSCPEAH